MVLSYLVSKVFRLAPAIKLADEGFVLDEALPTTIREGQAQFAKYAESKKVFMPGGKVPKGTTIELQVSSGPKAVPVPDVVNATQQAAVDALVSDLVATFDQRLLPWLDGPPQTNEVGRSAGLMTGLLHIAARYGPRVELLEIGSSAGLNLMIGHYGFDLGGTRVGPAEAALTLTPDWRGPPPPARWRYNPARRARGWRTSISEIGDAGRQCHSAACGVSLVLLWDRDSACRAMASSTRARKRT